MHPLEARSAICPRLVIAAPQGRSGKTTVALGICAALSESGLKIQPFKKGPDYIDPSWLSAACGRACRSLDSFFLPTNEVILNAFTAIAASADFSLIEGNHGLYDSLEPDGCGSTAALARTLRAPVILVINAMRMGRSVAALVKGYQTFEPETNIAAVILNNVAQDRHENKLRQAIEHYCHIPVIGVLPRDENLTIPDRHLGLVPRGETETLPAAIEACRQAAELNIDLESVVELARSAPEIIRSDFDHREISPDITLTKARIGVVKDRAFTFYYPENLEALEESGAELVFIDALEDRHLPLIDELYIGGGFPEMFLAELAANGSLRQEIREAVEAGLPVYAECGGLMYLSRRIHWGRLTAEMVGALPYEIEMTDEPQGHGYVMAECCNENPFFERGMILRGHEFHHSRLVSNDEAFMTAFKLTRGNGLGDQRDGLVYKNVLACYTHVHAGGTPAWAPSLVAKALENAHVATCKAGG